MEDKDIGKVCRRIIEELEDTNVEEVNFRYDGEVLSYKVVYQEEEIDFQPVFNEEVKVDDRKRIRLPNDVYRFWHEHYKENDIRGEPVVLLGYEEEIRGMPLDVYREKADELLEENDFDLYVEEVDNQHRFSLSQVLDEEVEKVQLLGKGRYYFNVVPLESNSPEE